MDNLKEIEARVAVLLQELTEALSQFPKETAQIMYAKQLDGTGLTPAIHEEAGMDRKKAEEGNQRLKKMMDEGRLKWEYASESQQKKVLEMEALIAANKESIKKLYENALQKP
jgi:hypothetical protein